MIETNEGDLQMSASDEGLLVSNEEGMYFIPADQLSKFKMTAAAEGNIRDALGEDDVAGFRMPSKRDLKGAEFKLKESRPIDFGFSGKMKPTILAGLQYSDMLVQ